MSSVSVLLFVSLFPFVFLRCGHNFCASHRYAETHDCTYDYKSAGRRFLQETNPLVSAPKLPKIWPPQHLALVPRATCLFVFSGGEVRWTVLTFYSLSKYKRRNLFTTACFSFRLSQVRLELCEQMDTVPLWFRLIWSLRSNVKMLIIPFWTNFSLFFHSFFVHLQYTTVTFVHVCMLVRVVAKYICCTFRRIYFLVCQLSVF